MIKTHLLEQPYKARFVAAEDPPCEPSVSTASEVKDSPCEPEPQDKLVVMKKSKNNLEAAKQTKLRFRILGLKCQS